MDYKQSKMAAEGLSLTKDPSYQTQTSDVPGSTHGPPGPPGPPGQERVAINTPSPASCSAHVTASALSHTI